jgi:hypothetical protein
MQNFIQVKDVLDYGKTAHADLRKFYESIGEQNVEERVRILLDYLSRHEKHLEETLERYETSSQQKVLGTWIQYSPDVDIRKLIDSKSIGSEMSVDDLVKLALEFDDALVELYRQSADECEAPLVKELFNNLIDQENQEKYNLMRAALFEDM